MPTCADAGGAFELHLDDLVGELRELAHGRRPERRHGHDRVESLSTLGDDRRVGAPRQVLDDLGDAVANVLGGDVDIAVEVGR